jgi:hypothetical protein
MPTSSLRRVEPNLTIRNESMEFHRLFLSIVLPSKTMIAVVVSIRKIEVDRIVVEQLLTIDHYN